MQDFADCACFFCRREVVFAASIVNKLEVICETKGAALANITASSGEVRLLIIGSPLSSSMGSAPHELISMGLWSSNDLAEDCTSINRGSA